MSNTEVDHFR